jgi:hypothetical protein
MFVPRYFNSLHLTTMNSEFLKRHAETMIRRGQRSRMAEDYRLPERYQIIDRANKRGFYIKAKNRLLKARMGGAKLEFPCIETIDNTFVCEISWALAERLANGTKTTIEF